MSVTWLQPEHYSEIGFHQTSAHNASHSTQPSLTPPLQIGTVRMHARASRERGPQGCGDTLSFLDRHIIVNDFIIIQTKIIASSLEFVYVLQSGVWA